MITIQELLFNRGLNKESDTKLVRHKDTRIDLYNLYRTDKRKFLEYQSRQSKDVFWGVDYIVSFIGESGTLARFIGVFKVAGSKRETKLEEIDEKDLKGKTKLTFGDTHMWYHYKYKLIEVGGFEDLKERVIIDWGKGAIKWDQYLYNRKEVVEIQPGLHFQIFRDFDFILSFQQLKEIIKNKYPDWKRMLSATNAVYLISDTKTGKQYVGSTWGAEGVWGRWSSYANTGHGNNKTLKELWSKNKNYADNYSFSILMLLPKTITQEQATQKETLYKKKLGTNSFGLNNN